MKVNAVNHYQKEHLQIKHRQALQAHEDIKRDNQVKTARADDVQATKNLIYKKEFDVIWLIQHSRIGGSVDTKA